MPVLAGIGCCIPLVSDHTVLCCGCSWKQSPNPTAQVLGKISLALFILSCCVFVVFFIVGFVIGIIGAL
jgi:hypothetical protein